MCVGAGAGGGGGGMVLFLADPSATIQEDLSSSECGLWLSESKHIKL